MSAGSIILTIVVVIVLVALIGTAVGISARRRRLREQFGPEYDRAVTDHQSRRLAEAELSGRQRRVQKLELTELSDSARADYAAKWTAVQERFVEAPTEAVAEAQSLIESVMRDRGYPVTDYEDTLTDLSVNHASALDHFRSAHDISDKAASGKVTTEELRAATLNYRELFEQLLAPETTQAEPTAQAEPAAQAEPMPDADVDGDVAVSERTSANDRSRI